MATKTTTLPSPSERATALKERRQLKMARSAHAYVRGNTKNFYEWLEGSTGQAVPAGPPIWICGDCHAGNIGPIASAKGTVAIQIRDLDQTVDRQPGTRSDPARAVDGQCGAGVRPARRDHRPDDGAARRGLRAELRRCRPTPTTSGPRSSRQAMKVAIKRTWKDLARERIEDTKPTIPLGKTPSGRCPTTSGRLSTRSSPPMPAGGSSPR
jgi:hypothetical protein